MNLNKLILFTSSFPFGDKENYLENEIQVLSKDFDEIEIYPHFYKDRKIEKRDVPLNVKVHLPALPLSKIFKVLLAFRGLLRRPKLSYFFIEFFEYDIYKSREKLKRWFFSLLEYLATIGSNQYKNIKEESNVIFYLYWGVGWAYSCLNLKIKVERTIFIRLHGMDAILEMSNGFLPVRKYVFDKADYLLSISENLKSYLSNKFVISENKIIVSRLGVDIPKMKNSNNHFEALKIISCSNVTANKRVSYILDAVSQIKDMKIEWIHFGDGPLLNTMKNQLNSLTSETVKINFSGRKSNKEILNYYKTHDVSVFVNVSQYEGVPVSIMEAMSHGIPCIATDAGATNELVNNENGILLENDFSISKLIKSLKMIESKDWNTKRIKAYQHCKVYYNSSKNYYELVDILKNNR
jgi:glycosyltransferase involved in cell wall biosynthesis